MEQTILLFFFMGILMGVSLASVVWSGIVANRNEQIDNLRAQLWDEIIKSPDRYGP